MNKLIVSIAAGVLGMATSAMAADMPVKAPRAAPEPSPWDLAFGGGIASDYIFRGITQSAHKPSATAYFEPRYNVNKDLQLYVGTSGESIDFPNRPAAEIDFYGGFRPTIGKFAFDFGAWYYWYPGGQCFNTPAFCGNDFVATQLPNGNVVKKDLSFWEVYGKVTFTVNDQFALGASVYYSPSVLNSGADGTYIEGTAKYTLPSTTPLPWGLGAYVSGAVGHWFLGTSDAFYGVKGFEFGIPYKSYTTWNVGIAFTKSVFTLDLRYYDTDLNKGDCNAFTSDHTASGSSFVTPINPSGLGSNWCGASFVAKGTFDLTAISNLK
jgi:uncharacterized protein (TIGR02001 family)